MTDRIKIGLDIDDVCRDFTPKFLAFYNRIHNTTVQPTDITSYQLIPFLKFAPTRKQLDTHFAVFEASDEGRNLPPLPGAIEGIRQLSQFCDVYWVTTSKFSDNVYLWFARNNLPLHNIFFTQNKGQLVKTLGLIAFVDDSVDNLEDIADKTAGKVHTIAYYQPWNVHVPQHYAHWRVQDWSQLVDTMRSIAQQ